jgi:Beta-propeller repeat
MIKPNSCWVGSEFNPINAQRPPKMRTPVTALLLCAAATTTAQVTLPIDHKGEPPSTSIAFVPQHGQIGDSDGDVATGVLYASYGHGLQLYACEQDLLKFKGTRVVPDTIGPDTTFALSVQLVGENVNYDPVVAHDDSTTWYHNYYLAHCPQGITGVHGFGVVAYQGVYPGIDMFLYSNKWGYKIYFSIAPGADPTDIALLFSGQDSLQIDYLGALRALVGNHEIRFPQAIAYQEINGTTVPVAGWPEYNFSNNNGVVTFGFDPYNTAYPLIIDISESLGAGGGGGTQVPEWGSYFGGNGGETVFDMCSTSDGGIAACGHTTSGVFPVSNGIDLFHDGSHDAFVVRFNEHYARTYCTFYGGDAFDEALGVAEHDGELYITGRTNSDPATIIWQGPAGSFIDGDRVPDSFTTFLTRFNADGDQVVWSTLFGLDCCMAPVDIAVDDDGSIVVGGTMEWSWPDPLGTFGVLPVTLGCTPGINVFNICGGGYSQDYMPYTFYQSMPVLWYDGWIAVFKNTHELDWSTLFGGSSQFDQITDIDVDKLTQDIYITGNTRSPLGTNATCTAPAPYASGFPWCQLTGAYNQTPVGPNTFNYEGNSVAFVASFDGQTHDLRWCTPFGTLGTNGTEAYALDVDEDGNAVYIVGITAANDYNASCAGPSVLGFPQCNTGNPFTFPSTALPSDNGFVAAFSLDDKELVWSSFISASYPSDVSSSSGRVAIVGDRHVDFPLLEDPDYYFNDIAPTQGATGFILGIEPTGQVFGTGWGGSAFENLTEVVRSPVLARIYVGGNTWSPVDMPYNCPPTTLPWCVDVPSTLSDMFYGQVKRDLVHIGVDEVQATTGSLLVYPNPATDQIHLSWPMTHGEAVLEAIVFNDLGQTALRVPLTTQAGSAQFSIQGLAVGFYGLALVGEGGEFLSIATFIREP